MFVTTTAVDNMIRLGLDVTVLPKLLAEPDPIEMRRKVSQYFI